MALLSTDPLALVKAINDLQGQVATLQAPTDITLASAGFLAWSTDLKLYRDDAGVLALRNGANAQKSNIYNTYTDTSNYERGFVGWVSNGFYFGSEAAGTGTARSIYFAPGGTATWFLPTSGHLYPTNDNTVDIGAVGSNRPRDLFIGRQIYIPGGANPVLRTQAAITSGAAAATGTLTNAPVAGNPAKWVPISDNGTTLWVPAWAAA